MFTYLQQNGELFEMNILSNSTLSAFLLLISIAMACPLYAEPTGLEVMQAADSRDEGKDLVQKMTQTLIDRNGNKRIRQMVNFRMDIGEDKKMISFFTEPANIRDTSLLTFDYDNIEADDDQWLYLPALKKVRRISSSDRGDYFMGTDFTFEDMKQTPELSDYHWKLLGSVTIRKLDCWKVEGLPASKEVAEELGYTRIVEYIHKETAIAIQVEYEDLAKQQLKRFEVQDMKEIQGIWSPLRIEMINLQSNHRTVIEFSDQKYNTSLTERNFTQRALKRGYRK